jgi:hypothetical protein
MPIGFMARLIHRTLRFAKAQAIWKYGLVMNIANSRGLLMYAPDNQIVSAQVEGPDGVESLKLLTQNIENLASSMIADSQGILEILIPCPHCKATGMNPWHMFSTTECEEAVALGHTHVLCQYNIPVNLLAFAPDMTFQDVPVSHQANLLGFFFFLFLFSSAFAQVVIIIALFFWSLQNSCSAGSKFN